MVKYESDELDRTFGALADPTRRAILARLASGEATVGELAAPFEMSLPAVSKHLRVLQRAGLLAQAREGRTRRCRLISDPLREARDWIEYYRGFWEQQLSSLESFLQTSEPGASRRSAPSQTPEKPTTKESK